MSTFYTQADLISKILEKLGVVPDGTPANSEDSARVEGNLQAVIDSLAAREIVYVPDIASIPSEWFLDLAKVCAYELRDEFGISGEQLQVVSTANAEGIMNLKVMTRGRPTYEPLKTVSF